MIFETEYPVQKIKILQSLKVSFTYNQKVKCDINYKSNDIYNLCDRKVGSRSTLVVIVFILWC